MYKALTLPLFLTLLLHGLIVAVILIDAPEAKPMVKRAATQYIKAELVTLDKPKVKKKTKPKPVAKPKKDNNIARQKALAEKKKAELQRKKQLQQKQLQQKKLQAKQEQQKQQQEQQRQQKLEQQRRLQQQSEQELADAIEQENALQQVESDNELANSYIALITEVIQNNWNRPPSARNHMETELALQLVPTGDVVSVRVIKSSGNAAFDRSAESAVLKAQRFPELQKLPARVFEKYFRRLRLKFRPEDLRL